MLSSHQRSLFTPSPVTTTTTTTTTTTLPPSTTDSFYYDNTTSFFHPSPVQAYPPSKRAKIEQTYNFNPTDIPSTFDCPPLVYPTAMPQAIHRQRPFAPHISLQRASEPASPVTIASTLSTHSTPSPSPSRVTIVGDNAPADFSLYEDGFPAPEHQLKLQAPRHRFTANTSNPSPTSFNGSLTDMDPSWPVCAPQVIDFSKVHRQQQQQQYFHRDMPAFNNNNGTFSHHSDDEELPALSPSRGTTSRPSISEGGDMPVTPQHSPIHHDGSHCAQAPTVREGASIEKWMDDCLQLQLEHVPKLNRTISDAVQDELFNPGIAPGTTHAQSERPSETNSHLPTLFQHAQNQHAMAARSTQTNQPMMMIRDHSPFRANSPFHPARTQQGIITSPTRTTAFLNPGPYASARARREKDIEREAEALREQMKKEYDEMQQAPKTISPKDAYIEYNEPEGNVQGSLFNGSQNDDSYSQHSTADIKSESDAESYRGSAHSDNEGQHPGSSRRASDVTMDYMYHGNAQQFGDHLNVPGYGWGGDESSSQGSTEPTGRNYELTSPVLRRPEDTMANDGAYSCTVHGCTERFSTASKMSKHRREAHRNNAPLGRDAPIKSLLQGPSRCARINPTTGKPCNTVFSRPYDLTRHEDTIHNTARQKVRCEICNDEKTFSRQDALTRHKKVKHGIDK